MKRTRPPAEDRIRREDLSEHHRRILEELDEIGRNMARRVEAEALALSRAKALRDAAVQPARSRPVLRLVVSRDP